MRVTTRMAVLMLAAWMVAGPAAAGAELVLSDGQVLRGLEVERRDGIYALTLEDGNVLTIPVRLVGEVRLTGEGDGGRAATGIRAAEPEQLAGSKVDLPKTSEMLVAFRNPSRFRRGPIDPIWIPTSDWDSSPVRNNNWNPARWYVAPIDPTWKPTPAFTMDSDVTFFNPARWAPNVINPFWVPSDGLDSRNEREERFRQEPPPEEPEP